MKSFVIAFVVFVSIVNAQQKPPPPIDMCNGRAYTAESAVLSGTSGSAVSDDGFFKISYELLDHTQMQFNISGKIPSGIPQGGPFGGGPGISIFLAFSENPCMPNSDVVVLGGGNRRPVISERYIPEGSYGEPAVIANSERNQLVNVQTEDGWFGGTFLRDITAKPHEYGEAVSISESTWWKWGISPGSLLSETQHLVGHLAVGSFHYNWHGAICSSDSYCNVCGGDNGCCKDYLYGTNECIRCTMQACPEYISPVDIPDPVNCNPRRCRTCDACCRDYLAFNRELCRACHESECQKSVCIPDDNKICTCEECCHPWYTTQRDCDYCVKEYDTCYLSEPPVSEIF